MAYLWAFLFTTAMVHADVPGGTDKASEEAIESLEAYAAYKMARHDEAFRRFSVLAEKDNIQGMLNVANMLAAGQGTEQDHAAALDWYLRAASRGESLGMYYAGRAYETGQGTDADPNRARLWYEKAAAAGSTEAQLALGKLHQEQGQHQEGIRWIQAAADAGDVRAQRHLEAAAQNSGTTVLPRDHTIILHSLQAVDRAMQHRNAPGVVHYIERNASVRLLLPNTDSWIRTDRKGLQALWQATFDRSGHYEVERSVLELTKRGAMIQVVSEIVEKLTGPEGERVLEMLETAEVAINGERMMVRALTLEIDA